MAESVAGSSFIPFPSPCEALLRLLGPPPAEAAVAVEPLLKLDAPHGIVQAYVGGLCGTHDELLQPVEILMLLDPAAAPPSEPISPAALLAAFRALPDVQQRLPVSPGCELIRNAYSEYFAGPRLYCRKRNSFFSARSPHTAEPLTAILPTNDPPEAKSAAGGLPRELLVWDGPPADGRPVAIYGARSGASAWGPVAGLDQLILDQGGVVRLAGELAQRDAAARCQLAAEHTCCTCPERQRCYPTGSGYAYAADRLVVVHALAASPVAVPLGEWRLDEAARMLGGVSPTQVSGGPGVPPHALEAYRRARAAAIESTGPRLLLAGEPGGRELAEIARLKLALIGDVLTQLDAAWRATSRPHLCWNDETVRVAWTPPTQTPAAAWGFRALLRKAGLQPACTMTARDGAALPYPPVFSAHALLAPEVVEAARSFGLRRGVNVFVKTVQKASSAGLPVHVLLEELGIPRDLFSPADVIHVVGEGWEADLAPAAEHNPDDGAGLGATGRVRGKTDALKPGESFEGRECRWYPRFGEAVDLHALGLLLFDTLLTTDERPVARVREAVLAERQELLQACRAVPVEQREAQARTWIATRCESDAPAVLWTRRNLLFERAARASIPLDGMPIALWQAIVTLGLRLIAPIAGFGYCADRASAAPRLASGHLLPLLELRGLIALLDDLVFARSAPADALRDALRAKD